ncbi:hypothetical protein [Halostagnicola kamekurae]|uniref:Yip1 domain-containing protein n=1 Tax=Halostagnicola kamekurae TaxID=619731 RepID=A0A1I6SRP6_9EURY|nr:hypothetical protein [Halostagnicola kamekurae]SFS79549.1 hypothetical protein SAMN04488556_2863 [Halostagnicola kamekurae]
MAVERSVGIREAEDEAFASAVIGALVAGVVFGILLHRAGRMTAVAALYGQDGVAVAWAFHFLHSFLAGVVFLAVVVLLSRLDPFGATSLGRPIGFPVATAVAGLLYGIVLWGLLVATLVPLWGRIVGFERPFPFLHRPTLVGLAVFGGLLGSLYGIFFLLSTRQ